MVYKYSWGPNIRLWDWIDNSNMIPQLKSCDWGISKGGGYIKSRGVSGIFEDMPVLIIVILGVSLFLLSSVHAYSTYLQNQIRSELREDAIDLSSALRSYDRFLGDATPGVFSLEKVARLNESEFEKDFPPVHLGFQYQVSLIVTSKSAAFNESTFTWSSLDHVNGRDTAGAQSFVLIDDGLRSHPARMYVLIWK